VRLDLDYIYCMHLLLSHFFTDIDEPIRNQPSSYIAKHNDTIHNKIVLSLKFVVVSAVFTAVSLEKPVK
jgi:hypothetical protein